MSEHDPSSGDGSRPLDSVGTGSPLDVGDGAFSRALVANAADGLLTIDERTTIVFANPAIERILGYSPAALMGRPLSDLLPAAGRHGQLRTVRERIEAEAPGPDRHGIELTAQHAEDREIPVSIRFREHVHDGQRLFTGVVRDVTDRRRRETERERYEDIVTHLPDGIYRTQAEPRGTFLEANPALRDMLAVESIDALLETGPVDFYADPEYRQTMRQQIGEDGILADEEIRLRTATGETIWTSVTAIEHEEHGETYIDGVVRDISERKAQERALREQRRGIEAILSHIPGILFTLDPDGVFTRSEGETLRTIGLEPGEAVGQSVFELYAEYPEIGRLCQRALEGERVEGAVELGERTFEATLQPVVDEAGALTQVVGFAYDVSERRDRVRTLERQRRSLERVQQLTESLRPLHRELAAASTPDEVEAVVCGQLAASDAYRSAWYGEYVPEGERVTPREWAGVEGTALDDVPVATDGSQPSECPIARAIQTGDVQAARNLQAVPSRDPWHEAALERGSHSSAAVPVVFGETVYGVIAVYSGRPTAFDEYEQGLLRDLGRRVGNALHAAENRRLLSTDTVVELAFRTTGSESVLVRTTAALGCRLELDAVAPAAEHEYLCYATVAGAPPAAVVDAMAESAVVDHARVVDATATGGTLEYRLREAPMIQLLEYGAAVTANVADCGEETLVGEVAPGADSQAIIAGLQESYSETTFVAKRTIDRPVQTVPVGADGLEAVLTCRQREVLTLAYRAGFFASPRQSTGEELADALGIASPTFYLHVRKATRNLLAALDDLELLE